VGGWVGMLNMSKNKIKSYFRSSRQEKKKARNLLGVKVRSRNNDNVIAFLVLSTETWK
jgi:hypothetical protein